MTPEERQMITDLANRIAQTPPPSRDPEAEELIRTKIGSRPDALYLMTQTVLIQNMAIDHARQEIDQLKRQAPAPAPQAPGGFLGGGGGWGSPQTPSYNAPPPLPSAPPIAPSGMSSFLHSAGTTAAGVAAGALAFEGIRSLFGGGLFGGGGHQQGMGSGFFGGQPPVVEETVNNYYDRPPERPERRGFLSDDVSPDDSADYSGTNAPAPSGDDD